MKPWTGSEWATDCCIMDVIDTNRAGYFQYRVQELCGSQGGRPGLSVLRSLTVSVDVKQHWTTLRHWPRFAPNILTDIRGHEALHHHHIFSSSSVLLTWGLAVCHTHTLSLRPVLSAQAVKPTDWEWETDCSIMDHIHTNRAGYFQLSSVLLPWGLAVSSGAVLKLRWPSWAPVPNEPTVSVDTSTGRWSHTLYCHGPCSRHNYETLKWLSSLPTLMQKSFWWWSHSGAAITIYSPSSPSPPPYPPPPFFSLINLMVSVDVKHHVYFAFS